MGLEEDINRLLHNIQVVAGLCLQVGDSGKGKIIDLLANYWVPDVTARGQGGNNAGHTTVIKGKEKKFNLIPAGIINDFLGKYTVLGKGMVIDVKALSRELDELEFEGATYNNLFIDRGAGVIMPYHIERDRARNQSQKNGGIGSTGSGIGPAYTDRTARGHIVINDLFDRDILSEKIEKAKGVYHEQEINTDDIIDQLAPYAKRIKDLTRDTIPEMHRFKREGKKILLEGAQGLLLSVEHGPHPFVTSSDASLNGTAGGVGLSSKAVDLPLGIIKYPFMSKVGGGPFPTELGGEKSEKDCAEENDIYSEVQKYLGMDIDLPHVSGLQKRADEGNREAKSQLEKIRSDVKSFVSSQRSDVMGLINSSNDFEKGVGIRLAAGEYGAKTGRPRRIGWTDAVSARYAANVNSTRHLILTKADCVAGADFEVTYGYKKDGKTTETFSTEAKELRGIEPVNKRYPAYDDISEVRDYESLPENFTTSVKDLENFIGDGAKVSIVSVGAERDATIVR